MAKEYETVKITEIQEASVLEQSAYVIVTQTGCSGDAVFRAPLSLLEEDLRAVAQSVASLPAASADTHGDIVLYDNGSGETLYVCAKSAEPGTRKTLLRNVRATESYEWVVVGGGSGLPSVTPDDNGKMLLVKDGEWIVADVLSEKQDVLTFDDVPTEDSKNPVVSGGIYSALAEKQDSLTFDSAPSDGSNNPVTSGGVFTALSGKQNSLTFDEEPEDGSENPVTSGGIYSVLSNKQDRLTFDSVPMEGSLNPVSSGGVFEAIENIPSLPEASVSDNGKILAIENGAWVKSDALSGKQNTLVFDSEPTQESTNPVRSSGVFSALQNKQDVLSFDSSPTVGSENPVTSGGIYEALEEKQDKLENIGEQPYDYNTDDRLLMMNSSGIIAKTPLPNVFENVDYSEMSFDNYFIMLNNSNYAVKSYIEFDSTPINGSEKLVTSGGIKTALDAKQDRLSSLSSDTFSGDDFFVAMNNNGELFKVRSADKQDSLDSVPLVSYSPGEELLYISSSGDIRKTGELSFLKGAFSGLESGQADSLIGVDASGNATKTSYDDVLNGLLSVQDFGQLVYNAIQQYLPA